MKIAIIGGGGRVGSCAAFALQSGKIVRELILLDANQAAAEGEALDLLHGSAFIADQVIRAGTYSDCAVADVVVITAGLRRKPDESRLDLVNRNVSLFRDILKSLKTAGLRKDAIVFVVSNPVDILTQIAVAEIGLPAQQVICWVLVISLPFTLPLMLWLWPAQPVRASAWGGFVYVTLFSMWLGFFAWYRGLALGGTVRVSQVQLVQPFLALLFAVPVLGEKLEATTVLFSLAVIAVVFASKKMPTYAKSVKRGKS